MKLKQRMKQLATFLDLSNDAESETTELTNYRTILNSMSKSEGSVDIAILT